MGREEEAEEEGKTEQMRDSWRGQASRHLRERLSILLATILGPHLGAWFFGFSGSLVVKK